MSKLGRGLAVAALAVAGLAGCGGSSDDGTGKAEKALMARSPKPQTVSCTGSDEKADCRVAYADGARQHCFVTVDGSSQSISCTGSEPAPGSPGTDPAERWAGTWRSTFGRLSITAHDASGRVAGRYESCDGMLEGTAQGDTLSGTWVEAKTCDTRAPTAPNKGTFTFRLDATGRSFAGSWDYDDRSRTPTQHAWVGTLQHR